MKQKKPGRPPKWKQGVVNKHYFLPKDMVQKIKADVEAGKFDSEVEAIYFYVMNAGELDKVVGELARLKRELEMRDAEREALKKRIEVLEKEKAEAVREAGEWEQKYRELEARLAETFVSVAGESEGVSELNGEDLISELERVDVVELAREYYTLKEALYRQDGFFVFVGGERLKRKDAEKKVGELRNKINQVLDLRGVPKAEAWKLINAGKLEELRKELEG